MKFKIIFILLLTVNVLNSQWQSDVRLTNNTAISYTSVSKSAASNGSYIYVVWEDRRNGNPEIYFKRSTNNGVSWGGDTRLTNNSATSMEPAVSAYNSTVNIVWGDNRSGSFEIYFIKSTDNGVTWLTQVLISDDVYSSYHPVIFAGSRIHVSWVDERNGLPDLFYSYSVDGGVNWIPDKCLVNHVSTQNNPSISVSGSDVHIAFEDERNGAVNPEIYYTRSTNNGVNWGTEQRLSSMTGNSYFPEIAVSGSIVYAVWEDNHFGNYEIYYSRSSNAGVNWGSPYRLTNNTSYSGTPALLLNGSFINIAWIDNRDGNDEIYFKLSANSGTNWSIDTRLTNNTSPAYCPSITASGTVINVLWTDERDGNPEIYQKRNPTGNVTAVTNISSEIPSEFSLHQNYPNPFNPATHFEFRIAHSGIVNLIIFDALGRVVETLVNEELKPGTYEAEWYASDYSSGVYYYRLAAGNFSETKKMMLVK